ncbi:MAG: ATP-binding protein [Candidatus Thiodiazotropha taylori]|nr:ATP-binding protein [Candidatus Thiodiazotropha taylori]
MNAIKENSFTTFKIKTSRTGEREFEFSRINVFLGANGTGKTKLLQELKGHAGTFLPGFQAVNIEGGRAVQMYDSLELTPQNFNQFRTSDQIINSFRGHRGNTLTSRIFFGLKALEQMGIDAKIAHSDAVVLWEEAGSDKANRPPLPDEPMQRVFETFNDIFPSITLEYRPQNRRLFCKKQGNEYGPTGLSDGEKQVFSILVDIIELTDSKSVLFIDEPELNLNPGLANRLWSSIEALLPEAIFIYATHSVSFAMRESVDNLVVMSNNNENIQQITEFGDLSHSDQEELLGNIPGLLAQANTLVVEGHDESFDSIFYHWLLEGFDFSPTAVGSSDDVIAITTREGKWKKITPVVKLTGIVDRDYKSDNNVDELKSKGVIVLEQHEAESYLCDPTLLYDLSQLVGASDGMISVEAISQAIFKYLEHNSLRICARRVNERLAQNIKPSVSSSTLSRITTMPELERLFLTDVASQLARANETLDEDEVKKVLAEENKKIQSAIDSKNLTQALMLTPGKELLKTFTDIVGVVDSNALARAARRHLSIESYPHLKDLRTKLCQKMSITTSTN